MNWESMRSVIVLIVTIILVSGTYWLVNRNSKNETRCKLGPLVLALYWLGAVMMIVAAASVFFANTPDDGLNDELWLGPALTLIATTILFFAIDGPFRVISWDDDHIEVKRLFRTPLHKPWSELTGISENNLMQYSRLEFADGTRVAFSEIMRGSHALMDKVDEVILDRELE